ncbi:MAG: GDSL-type esterase/lipase family protein [Brevibacterium sp.]
MITSPITEEFIRGTPYVEASDRGVRPHRLPPDVRRRDADERLSLMEAQPSGVHLAIRTAAASIAVELHATRVSNRGFDRPRGAVDIVIDGRLHHSHVLTGGDGIELDMATGAQTFTSGGSEFISVDGLSTAEKTVEFWLPHNEQVDLVALHSDAEVRPALRDGSPARPLWVHHGSSISHGSNSTHPTGIWPVIAARRAGVSLRNLGFGSSAMVDPFMARLIRDSPADLISVKLGINVVNLDAMKLRIFTPAIHGFLDTIRDGHPETPLLLVSPIRCDIHEETPGPGGVDPDAIAGGEIKFIATGERGDTAFGRLTLRVVRHALAEVVAARSDDPNLHYLDGSELYGADDERRHPLPDGLHPDTATHALIGSRFAEAAFGSDGVFRSAAGSVPE